MLEYARAKKDDELYTPDYLIYPIIKYIKKGITIWCPWDTRESNFVKIFNEMNYQCINSHSENGQNFFSYEPDEWDIIISNPPFSKKLKVFERLWQLNKPFAILMALPCLNYQEIGEFFCSHDGLQLMIFDKKVSFNGNTSSFNTSYFCRNLLDKDLIFEHLPDNNSGKFFRGIRSDESKNLFGG
jgi:hypothetical protein